jgi:hypothetical protein
MCFAICWNEAANGFHDIRHYAINNYTENSADGEKKSLSLMKTFMEMKGDGVKMLRII